MFLVRAGTQDEQVVDEVFRQNEYELPDRLSGTVIDIGANIGAFAVSCLERGADRVICFEPCPDAYRLLQKNTARFASRCETLQVPVFASGRADTVKFVSGGQHTACGAVHESDDGVPTVGLDEIIRRRGGVRLLKIDAEGSEYPILYTATSLHRVEQIVGEFHGIVKPPSPVIVGGVSSDKFNVPSMVAHLEAQGFLVTTKKMNDVNTLFWARRPAKT